MTFLRTAESLRALSYTGRAAEDVVLSREQRFKQTLREERMISKLATAAAVLVIMAGGAAQAEIIHFSAKLTGADEVPANSSAGTGELSAELETTEHTLAYRASYSGLTGPATMAHFHGPAAPGANGPPTVVVSDPRTPIGSSVILTPAQQDDLLAGKWYFNVHTAAHPGGEIRGQVQRLN